LSFFLLLACRNRLYILTLLGIGLLSSLPGFSISRFLHKSSAPLAVPDVASFEIKLDTESACHEARNG
jgi:hypothetical protein